jgi:dolichol-phosphate mannosyltransferase
VTSDATSEGGAPAGASAAAVTPDPVAPGRLTAAAASSPAGGSSLGVRPGTWIVLPTYNEAENLEPIATAILAAVPDATLLVVDDGSPDGTGALADRLGAEDERVRVRHRRAKQGLGRAYLDGFRVALDGGATVVCQMDADWSHEPTMLPELVALIERGEADLVIGSRYAPGGRVVDWGIGRRLISRGGSLFARVVLGLPVRDLTGGFKAWRASTLATIPFAGVHAGGYVFQIEMTYRAHRSGARIVERAITFRDRRAGQSKMSRRIVAEALVVVVALRLEELRSTVTRRLRQRR